ncbi:MAG: hypothetical protein ABS96_04705 [Lysobacteraceae bacterium SCN 69-123]|nr:MAG: hypothetical protein ABS96_04705 [Xanthomonadaceae bacterium SCN 69-123]
MEKTAMIQRLFPRRQIPMLGMQGRSRRPVVADRLSERRLQGVYMPVARFVVARGRWPPCPGAARAGHGRCGRNVNML